VSDTVASVLQAYAPRPRRAGQRQGAPLTAAAGIIFAVGAGPLFAVSAHADALADGGGTSGASSAHPCAVKTCPQ